eukprot:TRINITY_DN4690_c0_g1_i1.p1 TRINITY_DN4690_c0_g1~~TRINITY_DN4690_c0_g1_i1.p1  ORF type:complete len:122 (-),score=7.90 TRINITY_DN4690_c0_g1_i1:115-480(-)
MDIHATHTGYEKEAGGTVMLFLGAGRCSFLMSWMVSEHPPRRERSDTAQVADAGAASPLPETRCPDVATSGQQKTNSSRFELALHADNLYSSFSSAGCPAAPISLRCRKCAPIAAQKAAAP